MGTFQAGSVVIIVGLFFLAMLALLRAALLEDEGMRPYLGGAGAGLVSSLALFLIMLVTVEVLGVAPFNLAPSAAFLEALGWNDTGLAPLSHSVYGIIWALILVAMFGSGVTVGKAVGVAVGAQWLLFMVIYAPAMGWGGFGVGGPEQAVRPNAPMHLGSPTKFVAMTLTLHVLYGAINGWLIARFQGKAESIQAIEI